MIRIGIDARWIFPEITGIGSYTQELITHLAAVDPKNEYVLFFQHESVRERTYAYAKLDNTSRFRAVIFPHGPFSCRGQLAMPGLLKKAQLDVFHSTNFMIPLVAFPRNRQGCPACVITIHDLIPLLFPEHTPRALKTRFHAVYRAIMKEVGRRADAIITVSESSRRDIIQNMGIALERQERVVAIYEGAADRYAPTESRTDSSAHTILYVGRMDPYKNVSALVRAFAQVRKLANVDVRLQLIGPRDDRYPEVQRLIEQEKLQPYIDWPGYVSGENLLEAYRRASVFVLPSLYEGFGLPVLEAMACGTPVICSNRASLPEVAGDAALLFDPDNEGALVQALLSVLTDSDVRHALRTKGLRRAAQFSWSETARQTVAVYERLTQ